MSLIDQLLRRAVAVACVALCAETAGAQPAPAPLPTPTPAPAAAASSEPVVPASGIGRGPFGMRLSPHTTPQCAPGCAPSAPCPPAAPGAVPPVMTPPGTTPPGTTPPGMTPPGMADPNVPPAQPPAPAPAPNFSDFGRDSADVGQSVGVYSPNLFGDILGSRPSQVFVKQSMPGFLNGKTVVVAVNNVSSVTSGGMTTVNGNLRNGSFSIRDASGVNVVRLPTTVQLMGGPNSNALVQALAGVPNAAMRVVAGPISNPTNLSQFGIRGSFTESVPGVNQAYTPTGVNGASANYALQYFAGTSAAKPANVPFTIPGIVPVGFGRDNLALQVEQAVTPQATIEQFSLSPVQGVFDGTELRYISTINNVVSTPSVMLTLPNPGSGGGGGGVVGFIKTAEDNNPLPRDRFIFNYDYFDNATLTPGGIPVNRYQFGVEKTFLDGRASIEARLPFASTLNSDGMINGTGTNTELGNVRLTTKVLLLRRETINVSGGLGVYLPTADDLNIRKMDGSNLIRVENTSVQLAPFAAVLFTPNERLFGQAWMGFAFDTGGNQVTVDPMMFGGRSDVGNLRGSTLWTIDGQLGYWVYLADAGFVRGVAPFVELHYNGTVSNGNVLNAGGGFFIGDTVGNLDELNLTAGVSTRLGEQSALSVAFAAPLRDGQNRTFDYQIGVRFNYFFGYTARNQNRATRVNSFGG